MLNSPLDHLENLIVRRALEKFLIAENFDDLQEREAIQEAEDEANYNLQVFRADFEKLFDSEKPQSGYQIFTAIKDRYIGEYARKLRNGDERDSIKASWLLLTYGSDEQADVFLMGSGEKRAKLLENIIANRGMKSAQGPWVELP